MSRFNHSAVILRSNNIQKSIDFYKNIFNFSIDYISGNPINYAVVFRDEVYIHITNEKTLPYLTHISSVFIVIEGITEVYEKCVSEKTEILNSLELQNHGQGVILKEFTIKDPDGNTLRIGELIRENQSN